MTPGRWINLVAVALGAIGAFILYKWSFALEGFSRWSDDVSIKGLSGISCGGGAFEHV
jgi:hypothetical protein